MGYDIKYRQAVMNYIDEGHTDKETAATFKVSTFTIWKWKSKLKESGTLEAKKRENKWRKIDPEKLQKYIDENPDAYQREMAEAFGVCLSSIQKALQRLKITRKKNGIIQGSQR